MLLPLRNSALKRLCARPTIPGIARERFESYSFLMDVPSRSLPLLPTTGERSRGSLGMTGSAQG